MKTKIAILLLSAAALVSFTVINSGKSNSSKKEVQTEVSTASGGQLMSDRDQFN